MKQRIISSLIGLVLLAIVIFFYNTVFFTITIAVIILIAVHEFMSATGLAKYTGFMVFSMLCSLVFPFLYVPFIQTIFPFILLLLGAFFFILVLKYHEELRFEQMTMVLVFSVFVPLFFSVIVYLREMHGTFLGVYYLFLALGSAWLSDTGAYFAGMLFGKHKLAPLISPKKTVEGAVGGVVSATILNLLLAYGLTTLFATRGQIITVNYLYLGLISPILSMVGIVGDLTASVIKRQNNVKDYGKIMPGHGGVMDRFDSVLLILPVVGIISMFGIIVS